MDGEVAKEEALEIIMELDGYKIKKYKAHSRI